MSEKTLETTLTEVIGETMKPHADDKDTNKAAGLGETKSGETPEYVGGVDISDVPELDRPRIKELLSKKIALVEKGAQAKFQEIAKYKKEKDALLQAGLTEDEAVNVLRSHIEQKKNSQTTSGEKKEAMRTLDKMIEESPAETRESLRNLRQIIKEEGNIEKFEKALEKIEAFEKNFGFINQNFTEKRVQAVNEILETLASKYGKDFVDKNRDEVLKLAVQYPQADIKRILKDVSEPDEYEQAILSGNKKTEEQVKQKKINAISSPGSGITNSKENIDTKQSWKSFLSTLVKE